MTLRTSAPRIAVIGGGPAGLMAAEVASAGGAQVDLYDAMPSVGRKFLLAGKGGLNLTHGEPFEALLGRYGARSNALAPMLRAFGPDALRAWARGLGIETFVGSSQRVFPVDLKAAPLLRAWLHRLRAAGVRLHARHRWEGWEPSEEGAAGHTLRFTAPGGLTTAAFDAVVLALGGASWARLGSDGRWVPTLQARGVDVAPLRPSNCGFDVGRPRGDAAIDTGWSAFLRERFAGAPLKNVALSLRGDAAPPRIGEFVVTEHGIEGSLVYALSGPLRDRIERDGSAQLSLDLLPMRSADFVLQETTRPRGSRSLSTHLKSRLGLDGVKSALLHELCTREALADPRRLPEAIKALPITLIAARPIDEAISSAGGVRFEALDDTLMLRAPGLAHVYCAGEMLDWEAPTGGYLLTACFATGAWAGEQALKSAIRAR